MIGGCETSNTPLFPGVSAKTAWRFARVTPVVSFVTVFPTLICIIVRVFGPYPG
ncbi:MAG: hypothetical protein BWY93_02075 [Euryarchaeota archaeon ADurb.BinA087]|nr:MAG: hypothetical protein BWY93_02075 [Euryarchaeota archaeon ADurb.BinA087]